ncbi:MAG: prepilin peptidase [Rhodospirillaceae bacterium]|nr:prepilin peptidase [Rhodospirillaceae bacterium]
MILSDIAAVPLSEIASLPRSVWMAVAAVLGLVFGSFITALSYRVPRGQSIAHGRSQCPACGTTLTARDLIPVFSWLIARGRCRVCQTAISIRYPLIELLTAAVFMSAVWREPRLLPLLLLLATAVLMMTLAITDLEHRRLPFPLLVPLAVLGTVYGVLIQPQLLAAAVTAASVVLAGLSVAALSRRFLGRPLIGAGDVYVLAIGALMLPWLAFVIFMGLAGLLALIFGLAWRRWNPDALFPFGPSVFAALWVTMVFQAPLTGFVS